MNPAKHFDLCPWGKLIAMPHMGWQHAGWFASYVVNADKILEWGCGGNTLWMAMMNPRAHIISIEHQLEWAESVKRGLRAIRETFGCGEGVSIPCYSKQDYVLNPHSGDDAPWDLIFVDGQERPACLDASYDLLLPGGVVFLHDSQRPQYSKAKQALLEREGMALIDERVDESWVNQKAGMWAAQKKQSHT